MEQRFSIYKKIPECGDSMMFEDKKIIDLAIQIMNLCRKSEFSYVEINRALYIANEELYAGVLSSRINS